VPAEVVDAERSARGGPVRPGNRARAERVLGASSGSRDGEGRRQAEEPSGRTRERVAERGERGPRGENRPSTEDRREPARGNLEDCHRPGIEAAERRQSPVPEAELRLPDGEQDVDHVGVAVVQRVREPRDGERARGVGGHARGGGPGGGLAPGGRHPVNESRTARDGPAPGSEAPPVCPSQVFEARMSCFSIRGGSASSSAAFAMSAAATRPPRCAFRPCSSAKVSKIAKVLRSNRTAYHWIVPGSAWTISRPERRKSSTARSLPSFATSRTKSPIVTVD